MTKGGKKRKGTARSESQDSSGKYIPQFTKKRKLSNDSEAPLEENPEVILNDSDVTQPVEENITAVTPNDDNDIRNETTKGTGISEEESCSEVVLSDSNVVTTGHDNTAELPVTDCNDHLEEYVNETEKLPGNNSLVTMVDKGLPTDTMEVINQSVVVSDQSVVVSDQPVMVIDIPEHLDVVASSASTDKQPCYTDAATQVETSDNIAAHSNDTTAIKITSDPLIPALLDELSALNRLVMSCKRELETARRKHDIWMKNNKAIK